MNILDHKLLLLVSFLSVKTIINLKQILEFLGAIKQLWHEEVKESPQLIQVVLQRCPCEQDSV